MKELRAIAEAFEQARSNGTATALATVVNIRGSAYRRPGARMLITEDGQPTGTISGGCLERDVILRAQRVIERGEATLATYDSTDEREIDFGVGLGCGGVVQILIEPLPASEPGHLSMVNEFLRRRERGVLATVWQASSPEIARRGSHLLLGSDGEVWNDIGNPQLAAWIQEDAWETTRTRQSVAQSYQLAVGQAEVFLEVLQPPVPLVVFGGGHDAIPLVQFACELGWHVTVVDGRSAAASRTQFSRADEVVLCRPERVLDRVPLTGDTVAVVMTHNYRNDLELLKVLLPSPIPYVGLLGSRTRSTRLLQELDDDDINVTIAQRSKLHAPIGLDIGAETCEEIALAIVAEIRAALAGHTGGSLKDRWAPIHERAPSEQVRRARMMAVVESASCP